VNNQLHRAMEMTLKAGLEVVRMFVSMGTSGSSRKTSNPTRPGARLRALQLATKPKGKEEMIVESS
jgi:hypothetical protein